ncbi:hypothetical protein SK128_019436 [Halocaridina rubra]|uniref:Carboxylesterase type B domain-containing protein n=1 Tax=Halocaridina rubra TaxID=373956 RepID=A0AAN8ZNT9_HALRR
MSYLALLQNADLFNEIAENFERVAPTLLKIGDEDQAPTIAEAVFKHYTRNIPQDTDPSEKFVQMLSDGGFKVPQDELALLHSNQQKVYVYELQHKGQYSTTDLYNNTLGKEWVSHADDLQYLYGNNPYFPPLERAEDLQVQDTMLTLWTNFATTGYGN